MGRFGKWEQKCILSANIFCCFYIAGSHAARIDFELTVEQKMTLNSQSSCLCTPSTGIIRHEFPDLVFSSYYTINIFKSVSFSLHFLSFCFVCLFLQRYVSAVCMSCFLIVFHLYFSTHRYRGQQYSIYISHFIEWLFQCNL